VTDPPERRRRIEEEMRASGVHFGVSLVLMVLSILSTAIAGDGGWQQILALALSGGTLVSIIEGSLTTGVMRLVAWGVVAIGGILGSIAILAGSDRIASLSLAIVGVLIAVVAPVVVVRALIREPRVTPSVAAGVLLLYLLIGQFFVFAYRVTDVVDDEPFFAEVPNSEVEAVDYTYFSFVTLTTTGYGDLTARPDLGRMLAVSEAILGQLYLVSVVALVMGRLTSLPAARQGGSDPPD
jgi:hypothetical protein